MADKLSVTRNCRFTGEKKDFTEEEKLRNLQDQMQVKEEYPAISEQEEIIALLVLEIENLKTQIGGTV